jgi:hypothetical protein
VSANPPPQPPVPAPQPESNLGLRVLYMLFFGFVFSLLCWVLGLCVLLQLVLTLLADRPNPELMRFGTSLARYSRHLIEYLMFTTERVPYPFGGWPEE